MRSLFVFALLYLFGNSLLGAFQKGEYFYPQTFTNQFDKNITLTEKDKIIIVVFDKAGYYDVNEYLKTKPADYLIKNGIKYLNDISLLPQSIFSYFVKPRMLQEPFPILLIKDENASQELNYKDDMITIYHIVEMKITKIDFIKSNELSKYFMQLSKNKSNLF